MYLLSSVNVDNIALFLCTWLHNLHGIHVSIHVHVISTFLHACFVTIIIVRFPACLKVQICKYKDTGLKLKSIRVYPTGGTY